MLFGLGFKEEDMKRRTSEFSGGWQMRIALAKLLTRNPEILLLDEPTNHLDLESVKWLESFLNSYQGAVLMVSHDREFLDNTVSRVADIDLGKVTLYTGNYSSYLICLLYTSFLPIVPWTMPKLSRRSPKTTRTRSRLLLSLQLPTMAPR